MSQRCNYSTIYRANFGATSCVGGTGWQGRQEVVKGEKRANEGKMVAKGKRVAKEAVLGLKV